MEENPSTHRAGATRERKSGGTPRLRKSCDPCSLAKRRCDGLRECTLCLKKGLRCVYGERQKSGPKGRKGPGHQQQQQQQHPQQRSEQEQIRRGGNTSNARRRGPFVPARESGGPSEPDIAVGAKRSRLAVATAAAEQVFDRSDSDSYDEQDVDVRPLASRGASPRRVRAGGSAGGVVVAEGRLPDRSGGSADVGPAKKAMPTSWARQEGYTQYERNRNVSVGGAFRGQDEQGGVREMNGRPDGWESTGRRQERAYVGGGYSGDGESASVASRGNGVQGDRPLLSAQEERLHPYPSKYLRTEEMGWGGRVRQEDETERRQQDLRQQQDFHYRQHHYQQHQHQQRQHQHQQHQHPRANEHTPASVEPRSPENHNRIPPASVVVGRSSAGSGMHGDGRSRAGGNESSPHRQWHPASGGSGGSGGSGQRRPVSPSHVSRADVHPPGASGSAVLSGGVDSSNAIGVYGSSEGADGDSSRRGTAGWQPRRPLPLARDSLAPGPGQARVSGGGDERGVERNSPVVQSSARASGGTNTGTNTGSPPAVHRHSNDAANMGSRSGGPSDQTSALSSSMPRGSPEAHAASTGVGASRIPGVVGHHPSGAIAALPPPPSVASPAVRPASGADFADHREPMTDRTERFHPHYSHHQHHHQQHYQGERRVRAGRGAGRGGEEEAAGASGVASAATNAGTPVVHDVRSSPNSSAAAAAIAIATAGRGGDPDAARQSGGYLDYGPRGRGAGPRRWNEQEFWRQGGRGYQRWDARFADARGRDGNGAARVEPQDRHPVADELPPVARRHLLAWPIEKIHMMENMGANRADEDEETWVRIADAMESSVAEAKDQWAMYCDTMRRERWGAAGNGRGVVSSREPRAAGMWPESRPSVAMAGAGGMPPWTGGMHPGWRVRPETIAAGGYPGPMRGGPDAELYRAAYGGPGRPPAVVGRCAFCGELWHTNSPAAAVALQHGRWCCPACESGNRPGPIPRHWEDEEGYIAMPRGRDVGHHAPYYSGEAAADPHLEGRRQAWLERSRAHPDRAHEAPSAAWEEDMDVRAEAAEARTRSAAQPGEAAGRRTPPADAAARREAINNKSWRSTAGDRSHRSSPSPERHPLARAVTCGDNDVVDRRSASPSGPAVVGPAPAASTPVAVTGTAAAVVVTGGMSSGSAIRRRSASPVSVRSRSTSSGRRGSEVSRVGVTAEDTHHQQQQQHKRGTGESRTARDGPASGVDDGGDNKTSGRDAVGDDDDRSGKSRGDESGGGGGGDGDCRRDVVPTGSTSTGRGGARTLYTPEAVEALVEEMLAKKSAERVSDTLEESGHTTDQAHTPTRDTQPLPWVKEEDDRLMEAMEAMEASGDVNNRYRLRDWEIIARGCRGRTAGQCEMRWREHLYPLRHGGTSYTCEQELVMSVKEQYAGSQWGPANSATLDSQRSRMDEQRYSNARGGGRAMEGSSIRDRHPDHGAYGEDDRSSRRASPGDDERLPSLAHRRHRPQAHNDSHYRAPPSDMASKVDGASRNPSPSAEHEQQRERSVTPGMARGVAVRQYRGGDDGHSSSRPAVSDLEERGIANNPDVSSGNVGVSSNSGGQRGGRSEDYHEHDRYINHRHHHQRQQRPWQGHYYGQGQGHGHDREHVRMPPPQASWHTGDSRNRDNDNIRNASASPASSMASRPWGRRDDNRGHAVTTPAPYTWMKRDDARAGGYGWVDENGSSMRSRSPLERRGGAVEEASRRAEQVWYSDKRREVEQGQGQGQGQAERGYTEENHLPRGDRSTNEEIRAAFEKHTARQRQIGKVRDDDGEGAVDRPPRDHAQRQDQERQDQERLETAPPSRLPPASRGSGGDEGDSEANESTAPHEEEVVARAGRLSAASRSGGGTSGGAGGGKATGRESPKAQLMARMAGGGSGKTASSGGGQSPKRELVDEASGVSESNNGHNSQERRTKSLKVEESDAADSSAAQITSVPSSSSSASIAPWRTAGLAVASTREAGEAAKDDRTATGSSKSKSSSSGGGGGGGEDEVTERSSGRKNAVHHLHTKGWTFSTPLSHSSPPSAAGSSPKPRSPVSATAAAAAASKAPAVAADPKESTSEQKTADKSGHEGTSNPPDVNAGEEGGAAGDKGQACSSSSSSSSCVGKSVEANRSDDEHPPADKKKLDSGDEVSGGDKAEA